MKLEVELPPLVVNDLLAEIYHDDSQTTDDVSVTETVAYMIAACMMKGIRKCGLKVDADYLANRREDADERISQLPEIPEIPV